MLVEIAIADAFGAGFEQRPQEEVDQFNDLTGYRPHALGDGKPGRYTDDTQMTIALAELALAGEPWTLWSVARAFVETYRRDPRPLAYSRRMRNALEGSRTGEEFLAVLGGAPSTGSGTAMRALPCGLADDLRGVRWRARIQAEATHRTLEADLAARAVAMAACTQLQLRAHPPYRRAFGLDGFTWERDFSWAEPWTGRVPSTALACARAAITAADGADSLRETLRKSVAFGGDTDTVAAIAVGLASLAPESRVERDLPDVLYDQLEDGPFGRRYLEDLDRRLAATFNIPNPES